ncbi:MAG: DcrB-related protein [Thermoflexales bacterium]
MRPTPRPTLSPTPTPTKAPAATADERIEERDGGFAYIPPAGWRTEAISQSPFEVLFAPSDGSGFTANVNFNVDESGVDLETYIELAIEELKKGISGFTLRKEERLSTDQGSDVVKLTTDSTLQGRRLRQVYYLVELGPRRLIVTYTRLQNSQQRYDRDVDNFVKTIELLEVDEEQTKTSRHSEPDGGFSYVIPEGWELEDIPNAEFKSLVNPGEEGSAKPTVAFFTLDDPAPIDQAFRRKYRTLLPNRLREFYGGTQSVRLVRDSLFTTDAGYDAAKFILEGAVANQRAQITAYIVDVEGRKIAALYARPRGSSAENDEQIEAMINTLGPADAEPAADAEDTEEEATEDGRHYEPLGDFSYNLPQGWSLKSPPRTECLRHRIQHPARPYFAELCSESHLPRRNNVRQTVGLRQLADAPTAQQRPARKLRAARAKDR